MRVFMVRREIGCIRTGEGGGGKKEEGKKEEEEEEE